MNGNAYASVFVQEDGTRVKIGPDTLVLPHWRIDDWRKVLSRTTAKPFRAGEVVVKRGERERALYFVAAGTLQVGVTTIDGVSLTPIVSIGPVSVLGEQSFFDAEPRSANVWGLTEGVLLRLEVEGFQRFGADEPRLACELVCAVARVLSTRLRLTTLRVRR